MLAGGGGHQRRHRTMPDTRDDTWSKAAAAAYDVRHLDSEDAYIANRRHMTYNLTPMIKPTCVRVINAHAQRVVWIFGVQNCRPRRLISHFIRVYRKSIFSPISRTSQPRPCSFGEPRTNLCQWKEDWRFSNGSQMRRCIYSARPHTP